jgi:hypothetical protein
MKKRMSALERAAIITGIATIIAAIIIVLGAGK